MILNIDIEKIAPGIYQARPHLGGTQVRESANYDRIDDAIRQESLGAEGFANFVEFSYGGMSTGTYVVEEAATKATELANRLVSLIAETHLIRESR